MMTFKERIQSATPDTTLDQALAMLTDLATSKEFKGLKPYQKLYIARIEQMIRKDIK
jgi:hypothetical protein